MSDVTTTALTAPTLGPEVLAHLDHQLHSARRLLASVLRQGAAIRARKVEAVVACMAEVKSEMDLRGRLENERSALLAAAAVRLGTDPSGVTLEALVTLMSAPDADAARTRSAELRGLLGEIAREHGVNRALMRQELAFLDHLARMIGQEPRSGYRPGGVTDPPGPGAAERTGHRVFDLQA